MGQAFLKGSMFLIILASSLSNPVREEPPLFPLSDEETEAQRG
jgi:hypothetical protein